MAEQSRRNFLKTLGTATAAVSGISMLNPSRLTAAQENVLSKDRMGVLLDTTACIGCRKCEWACKKAHNMPVGDVKDYEDNSVFNRERRPDHSALTVVNRYVDTGDSKPPVNVKVQCMHCDRPACVSACIVGAFSKKENGAVIWDDSKCIGCRYCMVACPFQIPAFDYHKAIEPEITKCDFCYARTTEGKLPACVEICPMEVMVYGKRTDLLSVAHHKIETYPDRYYNHVLGEFEVGGTSWMYLASKEFEKLHFPKLGESPAPGVSESIQHGIFAYFVPPIALYALLGGIMWINKNTRKNEGEA